MQFDIVLLFVMDHFNFSTAYQQTELACQCVKWSGIQEFLSALQHLQYYVHVMHIMYLVWTVLCVHNSLVTRKQTIVSCVKVINSKEAVKLSTHFHWKHLFLLRDKSNQTLIKLQRHTQDILYQTTNFTFWKTSVLTEYLVTCCWM